MNAISQYYAKAKAQGRLCGRCGWIVTVKRWKAGYKLCASCQDAMKGVNIRWGNTKPAEEATDRTGEML